MPILPVRALQEWVRSMCYLLIVFGPDLTFILFSVVMIVASRTSRPMRLRRRFTTHPRRSWAAVAASVVRLCITSMLTA